jgi:hypothetical protein
LTSAWNRIQGMTLPDFKLSGVSMNEYAMVVIRKGKKFA